MTVNLNLKRGVNLGGWLSQYKEYDQSHFETFIQEVDITRIASWGMDHIRLPVDYPVLEKALPDDQYEVTGFEYLDQCLKWCQKQDLDLLIDLHKAPGYAFGEWEKASLFSDPKHKQRFLQIWAGLADHYRGIENIGFELLNEIRLPDSTPWNQLIRETIAVIHEIDPDRPIMIGGNNYNSPDQLQYLDVFQDQRILYTFHFYYPMVVTHQRAYWVPPLEHISQEVNYPGPYPIIDSFGDELIGKPMDRDLLKLFLKPALDFMENTGKQLYCGEFGVIDRAPLEARINWTRDMVSLFSEFDIGWALWSYKAMDFGLVDLDGKLVSEKHLNTIRK
jgi:hypothetical protein